MLPFGRRIDESSEIARPVRFTFLWYSCTNHLFRKIDKVSVKQKAFQYYFPNFQKRRPVRFTFLYSRFCFRIRCIFCVAALRGDARNEEKKN